MIQTRALKMEDSLSYWVKSSQIGPYVQIKNCISEFFKTNVVNYLPKECITLRNISKTTGKYTEHGAS